VTCDKFKRLTPEEEKTHRQWARDNYTALQPIEGVWHPVVQDECVRMNEEHMAEAPWPTGANWPEP
jgi:hypothetical protein